MHFLHAAALSHTGNLRRKNEDNLLLDHFFLPEIHGSMRRIKRIRKNLKYPRAFAVFDGMGGYDLGERASWIAAELTKKKMRSEKPDLLTKRRWLEQLCEEINLRICNQRRLQRIRMGTTIALLLFHEMQVSVCNLGDSPILRFRNHQLETIYEEHTERKREEALFPDIKCKKYPLTQAVGVFREEMKLTPYITTLESKEGDYYLICSDGLTDMVCEENITEVFEKSNNIAEIVRKLMDMALDGGGRDNITLICIQISR